MLCKYSFIEKCYECCVNLGEASTNNFCFVIRIAMHVEEAKFLHHLEVKIKRKHGYHRLIFGII